MNVQVKIKNLPEIRAAFAKSPRVMTKNLNQAIRRVGLEIGADSRRNTPVDTGRLRSSHYENFTNLKGIVGTDTNYDFFVHEGTRFMKARPFLAQAVQENERFTDKEFTKAVQDTLDEIGRSV